MSRSRKNFGQKFGETAIGKSGLSQRLKEDRPERACDDRTGEPQPC